MDEQPTCGKGLAANSVLPKKLSELIGAQAEVVRNHMRALDLADPNSVRESELYADLARQHEEIALRLESLATHMAESRDLPMGRHDMAVMTDPEGQMKAFRRFVELERELLGLLQNKLATEEALLRQPG